ncbi:unnamed protein product, partial [Prorocentrum cordatum]
VAIDASLEAAVSGDSVGVGNGVAQAIARLTEELADYELLRVMLMEAAGPVTDWTPEREALPEAEQAMASAAHPLRSAVCRCQRWLGRWLPWPPWLRLGMLRHLGVASAGNGYQWRMMLTELPRNPQAGGPRRETARRSPQSSPALAEWLRG